MLTQALQSVQATMQATGQSPAQLTGPNQNLAQAAQGVVSGQIFCQETSILKVINF